MDQTLVKEDYCKFYCWISPEQDAPSNLEGAQGKLLRLFGYPWVGSSLWLRKGRWYIGTLISACR